MVSVNVTLDGAGLLKCCRACGHAGAGRRGSDLVCAAISVLTRTLIRTLADRRGITIRGSVGKPGDFLLEVEATPEGTPFLDGAGAFFVEGALSVSAEFPDYCTVTIESRPET
ncbi:MAG: ribosomal-processing cysteine protease Prp [Treponema sp.]|nr:ribosomal-processing cysteine protease Prp [Treponema sp.]